MRFKGPGCLQNLNLDSGQWGKFEFSGISHDDSKRVPFHLPFLPWFFKLLHLQWQGMLVPRKVPDVLQMWDRVFPCRARDTAWLFPCSKGRQKKSFAFLTTKRFSNITVASIAVNKSDYFYASFYSHMLTSVKVWERDPLPHLDNLGGVPKPIFLDQCFHQSLKRYKLLWAPTGVTPRCIGNETWAPITFLWLRLVPREKKWIRESLNQFLVWWAMKAFYCLKWQNEIEVEEAKGVYLERELFNEFS